MRTEIVEVIYGKHRVYEVSRVSGLLGTEYRVRASDGKHHGSFRRLDEAVARARECARKA
ncbi:MAG: hypothetical protein JNN03_18605 [Rubrivivax sp.]|nr:hypothetical protein [Rubrivivax sp.]